MIQNDIVCGAYECVHNFKRGNCDIKSCKEYIIDHSKFLPKCDNPEKCQVACEDGWDENTKILDEYICCKKCGRAIECDFVSDECNSCCRIDLISE